MMKPDLWFLYRQMLRSRLFEEIVKLLWDEGQISGEMHMSIGEEAVAAGVVTHLRDGDAMALDHRPTSSMIIRGIDPVSLLRELLGRADGLCAGHGGHMHLYSQEHLSASSGIVGASGPAGVGFALAAKMLRPGKVAVAFFGEGAMNQGMMLESLNLAVVWKLPAIFVCKDNGWAITTESDNVTSGSLDSRARNFGLPAARVDSGSVETIWQEAQELIEAARHGAGPAFIHASCSRPDGHMLGDLLLRSARQRSLSNLTPLVRTAIGRGDSIRGRLASIGTINEMLNHVSEDHTLENHDPLLLARRKLELESDRLRLLEQDVAVEMEQIVSESLRPEQDRGSPR